MFHAQYFIPIYSNETECGDNEEEFRSRKRVIIVA